MDFLHTYGVACIQKLQYTFSDWSETMLVMSHLGDPRNAFLIYFPIAYCVHRSTGARVLWLACLTEWINAILKWLFHGERPFWWVRESGLYPDSYSVVRQYRLTCETGPGSPSGHAMVTASVMYCMLSAIFNHLKPRPIVRAALWIMFILFLLAVNVSRVFIATHFPHQVIFGTIVGLTITRLVENINIRQFRLAHYLGMSILIPVSCIGLFYSMTLLDLDPQWSITMAVKWCKKASWVHPDTMPFNAIYRDAGSILGFGIASFIMGDTVSNSRAGVSVRCLQLVLSLVTCMFGENVKPIRAEPGMFYLISYLKFCFIVIVVCLISWFQPGRWKESGRTQGVNGQGEAKGKEKQN